MVKKLKQGERYPEGFIQSQILLKLCGNDITPTSEIIDFLKDQFGIREQKNIRIHLKKLEDGKLVKKDSAGLGHVDYWSVISDFKVLSELVERFKYDPDLHHIFMESSYYRDWIPELVQRYADLIPSADAFSAWFAEHLHENDLNCHIQLSERDRKVLTESLETSWFMLCHVSNFISLPNEFERIVMLVMISHLQYDINNSPVSPIAAWKDGLLCGVKFFCKRTNTPYDDIKPAVDDLFDALRHAPIINWTAYFKQAVQTDKYHRLVDGTKTYD
jgi:hypothetical protein